MILARALIQNDIPPLRPTDSTIKALGWMDEFKVVHLPVVEGANFLGSISEIDLLDQDAAGKPIGQCNLPVNRTAVSENQHVFEVVKVVSEQHLSLVPVLDIDDRYLGCVSVVHLMEVIADMPVVKDPGGIIIIEMNVHDFSMSQVSQIVEGNDARILGAFITRHTDSTRIELTLKTNQMDLSRLLQTFERYQYNVTASYDQGAYQQDLQKRFDLLMNYLKM